MTAGTACLAFYSGLQFFDTADYCQPQRPNRALFGTRRQNTMDGDDLHLLSVPCSGADVSRLGRLRQRQQYPVADFSDWRGASIGCVAIRLG